VGLFSYGSGLCSSMYSLRISSNATPGSPLSRLIDNLSHIKQLLDQRTKVSPEDFAHIMETREQNNHEGEVICSYLLNQYVKWNFKGSHSDPCVPFCFILATSVFSYSKSMKTFVACTRF
jgi:3-hydroxy-3-methylglutaryl CoA synthase